MATPVPSLGSPRRRHVTHKTNSAPGPAASAASASSSSSSSSSLLVHAASISAAASVAVAAGLAAVLYFKTRRAEAVSTARAARQLAAQHQEELQSTTSSTTKSPRRWRQGKVTRRIESLKEQEEDDFDEEDEQDNDEAEEDEEEEEEEEEEGRGRRKSSRRRRQTSRRRRRDQDAQDKEPEQEEGSEDNNNNNNNNSDRDAKRRKRRSRRSDRKQRSSPHRHRHGHHHRHHRPRHPRHKPRHQEGLGRDGLVRGVSAVSLSARIPPGGVGSRQGSLPGPDGRATPLMTAVTPLDQPPVPPSPSAMSHAAPKAGSPPVRPVAYAEALTASRTLVSSGQLKDAVQVLYAAIAFHEKRRRHDSVEQDPHAAPQPHESHNKSGFRVAGDASPAADKGEAADRKAFAMLYFEAACLHISLGQYSDALYHAKRACDVRPRWHQALCARGYASLYLRDLTGAESAYAHAKWVEPKCRLSLFSIARQTRYFTPPAASMLNAVRDRLALSETESLPYRFGNET